MKKTKRLLAMASAIAILASTMLRNGRPAFAENAWQFGEAQGAAQILLGLLADGTTTTTTATTAKTTGQTTTKTTTKSTGKTTTGTTTSGTTNTQVTKSTQKTTTSPTATTTTTTVTTKDLSEPELDIRGNDAYAWVQSMKNLRVLTSKNATVYYKVAKSENASWGSYKNASKWTEKSAANLPEGKMNIHFWAVYPDPDCRIAENTISYRYDCSAPANFNLSSQSVYKDWNRKLVVSGSNITDNASGVASIYYWVSDWYSVNVSANDIKTSATGEVSFSTTLDAWLNDVPVTFFVEDLAGNTASYSLGNVSNDPHAPVILTDAGAIGITNSAQKDVPVLRYLTFGHESLLNLRHSVYANDYVHFLKMTIQDAENNLQKIVLTINEETKVTVTANGDKRWICEDTESGNTKTYYIRLADLGLAANTRNSISMVAWDSQNDSQEATLQMDGETYTVFYDPYDAKEDCLITFTPDESFLQSGDKAFWNPSQDSHAISIIMEDDNGLAGYRIQADNALVTSADLSEGASTEGTYTQTVVVTDVSGMEVLDEDGNTKTQSIPMSVAYYMPEQLSTYCLSLNRRAYMENRTYNVDVQVSDLAGNSQSATYSFTVDTTAPTIQNYAYSVNKSILKYFTFGIFGNDSVSLTIDAFDNEGGIGIDPEQVTLYWAAAGTTARSAYAATSRGDGKFEFEALPIGGEAVPYIVVADQLGNRNTYYFEDTANQLSLEKTNTTLCLENDLPTVGIDVVTSAEYTGNIYTMADGSKWYPCDISYAVTACDENSGLQRVIVQENAIPKAEPTTLGDIDFAKTRYRDTASYSYAVTRPGSYTVTAHAYDNAGNKSDPANLIFHVDKEAPVITEFQFKEQVGNPTASGIVKGTYGFYFQEAVEARVYIEDPGISAGFDGVTMFLTAVDGTEQKIIVDSSSLTVEEDVTYASFTVPLGFKGQVAAMVVDRVGHNSGKIGADGNIIENAEIHDVFSAIAITEANQPDGTDAREIPLYRQSIPLTIALNDSFSGISTIAWSIANDAKSGVITIDNNGSYWSDSPHAAILEDTIARESNLITALAFSLFVESNTNGNVVHIVMTDRAGNTSEYSKTYSVDTTVPTMQAVFSNNNLQHEMYYNSAQTVTLTVTERNFLASDVVVLLNGERQTVQWDTTEPFVGADDTMHTGRFTISQDGNYTYAIQYADRAGNAAEAINQPLFIIDTTSPQIQNNFKTFGAAEDAGVYFNAKQTAVITVKERNFYAEDLQLLVSYKPAGAAHTATGEWQRYSYVPDWITSGDTHTLNIPFMEDGVYKISMAPVDRAGNTAAFDSSATNHTAVFEMDFTAPKLVARNDVPAAAADTGFLDVYGLERRNDAAPSVAFDDCNFDYLTYSITRYTPAYENGKELAVIKPVETVNQKQTEKLFTLPDFAADGVYAVKITAYDKAGNASLLNESTYMRMMNTEVLAYIEDSNAGDKTGWYSFADTNGPISKRPDSFDDLSIVVLSREDATSRIVLRNEEEEETDTGITAKNTEDMYGVGLYRYTLPGSYFAEKYTEDADTRLYLRVNNAEKHIELGEIYIDNTVPQCEIPEHFKNWGWFRGSGEQTITFSGISEVLDQEKSVAYVDGKAVPLTFTGEREVSLTLQPGSYNVGVSLVDRAGNAYNIPEVTHLAVGNIRLWMMLGAGIGVIVLLAAVILIGRMRKRRRRY